MPRPKFKGPRSPTPTPSPSPEQGETEEEEESEEKDSFARLCKDLRKGRHMTQEQVGQWFAVSAKTFARWEDEAAFPTRLQIPGVIAAIGMHAPDLVDRASPLLGVASPPRPAALGAPAAVVASPTITKIALEGALFEAAERLGVSSARTREVAVLLLERAALLGLGVSEAAAILRGPSPRGPATSSDP
jgi:DNA-binding XRE family transcriptional regulator